MGLIGVLAVGFWLIFIVFCCEKSVFTKTIAMWCMSILFVLLIINL